MNLGFLDLLVSEYLTIVKKYRKPEVFVVVFVSFRTICIKMDGFFFWCNKVPTLYSGRLALAVRNN